MNIRFPCPGCDAPGRISPDSAGWRCPGCDHEVHLRPDLTAALPACGVCGSGELYKKKDFPHALGMGILVTACAASTVTYYLYDKLLTWGILLGSAAFDGLLYLAVGDVIVCYRCGAQHRGVTAGPGHKPFELTVHERYRQERLRHEALQAADLSRPPFVP